MVTTADGATAGSLQEAKIHVVVDSTELWDNFRLRNRPWLTLRSLSASGHLKIYIPEVVVRETERHFARETEKNAASAVRMLANLHGNGATLVNLGPSIQAESSAAIEAFPRTFRALLGEYGITILALPKMTVAEIMDRDLSERKPFDDKGKGFRDTLTWGAVLELAQSLPTTHTVHLLSNNTKDFAAAPGPDPRLADDLIADISQLTVGKPMARVEYGGGLGPFLNQPFVAAWLEEARSARQLASDLWTELAEMRSLQSSPEDLVRDAITDTAEQLVGETVSIGDHERGRLYFGSVDLPTVLSEPSLLSVDLDLATLVVSEIERFQDTTLLADVSVEAEVEIDGYMHKADLYLHESPELNIMDSDWNEHTAWVSVGRRVRLLFNARVEVGAERVDDIEFVAAEGF